MDILARHVVYPLSRGAVLNDELSSQLSCPTAETLSVKFDHTVARREERVMYSRLSLQKCL
jgi:hypothetical protein